MWGPTIVLMGGLDSQFEDRHVGSNHRANGRFRLTARIIQNKIPNSARLMVIAATVAPVGEGNRQIGLFNVL